MNENYSVSYYEIERKGSIKSRLTSKLHWILWFRSVALLLTKIWNLHSPRFNNKMNQYTFIHLWLWLTTRIHESGRIICFKSFFSGVPLPCTPKKKIFRWLIKKIVCLTPPSRVGNLKQVTINSYSIRYFSLN